MGSRSSSGRFLRRLFRKENTEDSPDPEPGRDSIKKVQPDPEPERDTVTKAQPDSEPERDTVTKV